MDNDAKVDRGDLPVFYGLPLLDDDGEMRTVSKQDLRQLRRPVRGAFTGGFSAGYFNTVSSEAGFEPQAFYSTRGQRSARDVIQRPEDFMDKEDFAVHGIAPKLIKTREEFTTGSVHGLNVSAQAIKLLECLGWKQGRGLGPKVPMSSRRGYCPEEFKDFTVAPLDAKTYEIEGKNDTTGIGYVGLRRPELPNVSKQVETWLPRGQAFGVGVLNDSDDDQDMMAYGEECMDDYDFEIGSKDVQKTKVSSELPDFEYVKCLESVTHAPAYDAQISARSNKPCRPVAKPKDGRGGRLSIQQRASLLDFKTEWESQIASTLSDRFRPKDSKEEPKQKNDEVVEIARMGLSGKLTRQEEEWTADNAVYKMFNLAAPSGKMNTTRDKSASVFDVLDDHASECDTSSFPVTTNKSLGIAIPSDNESAIILAQLDQWRKEVDEEQSREDRRPPIDLFKAIFSDQSEKFSKEDDDEYYGPKLPPNLDQLGKSTAPKESCWEAPTLDSSCFVEREIDNEQQGDGDDAEKWAWATRGLGTRKRARINRVC